MSPSRLVQVTATGDVTYEIRFDGSAEPSVVVCTVDMSGVVPGVSVRPDPFMTGDYGDPRPVMATVLAMHRARQLVSQKRSKSIVDFLSVYLSEELAGAGPKLKDSMLNGGSSGAEKLRVEFVELLNRRDLDHRAFWEDSSVWYDSDEEMYAAFEDTYRFFFDREPPRPDGAGS